MPRSAFILVAAFGVGVTLALLSLQINLPTGWLGGASLISWTLLARRRWAKLEKTTGLEPGGPERVLRFHAVATALLFSHMITSLVYPGVDLHVGHGNYLAIDSWTMITAMLVGSLVMHRDGKIRDERDAAIIARGTKAGLWALIAMLIVLSSFLAVQPSPPYSRLSHFVVGNFQIAVIVASLLVKYTVQLVEYAKDTDAALALGEDE